MNRTLAGLCVSLLVFAGPHTTYGLARVFMATLGQQAMVPQSGPHTIFAVPGATIQIEVWIANTSPERLGSYQLAFPGVAALAAGSGSVSYVDTPGIGGSVDVDTSRPDWVFQGFGGVQTQLNDSGFPAGFAVIGLLPPGNGPFVSGPRYAAEFTLDVSPDAFGTFVVDFLPLGAQPDGGSSLVDSTALNEIIAEYQPLVIKVGVAPPNDQCIDQAAIGPGDTAFDTRLAVSGAPVGGFGGPGNSVCGDNGLDVLSADVWYAFTSVCGGNVQFSTCDQADFDTRIEVYQGCSCSPTVLAGCSDDPAFCGGGTSFVEVATTEGTCYLVRIGGAGEAAVGTGTLSIVTQATRCPIGGVCYDPGAVNPANDCEYCIPNLTPDAWTPRSVGTSCGDSMNTSCDNPDTCDGMGSCLNNYETNGVPCPNNVFCDGDETCSGGLCTDGPDPCFSTAVCDEAGEFCLNCASGAECGDFLLPDGIADDGCLWYSCLNDVCSEADRVFGDVGGPFGECAIDGFANLMDANHVLGCFAVVNSCDAINIDVGGQFGDCGPDGFCNIFDVNHILEAFAQTSACSCPLDGAGPSPSFAATRSAGSASLRLVADRKEILSGETVDVRVIVTEALKDLRSYQLELSAKGGNAGAMELIDVFVSGEPAKAFGDASVLDATNLTQSRMLRGLTSIEGVGTRANGYLATFRYRASETARGLFEVSIPLAGQTYLIASQNGRIVFSSSSVEVNVSGGTKLGLTR